MVQTITEKIEDQHTEKPGALPIVPGIICCHFRCVVLNPRVHMGAIIHKPIQILSRRGM